MSLKDSLFAVSFAAEDWAEDGQIQRGKNKGKVRLRHAKTGRTRVKEEGEEVSPAPAHLAPIEQGANLNDPVDRLMLHDKALEEGRPREAAEHRRMATWVGANGEQIMQGHPFAPHAPEERRQAATYLMADTAGENNPAHWDPFGLRKVPITPDLVNRVADAVEKLDWDSQVLRKGYKPASSLREAFEAARGAIPDLTAMQFLASLEFLDRNHVIGTHPSLGQGDAHSRTAEDWAVAMPRPHGAPDYHGSYNHSLVLHENGDGYTLRSRFRPDGTSMNLGHGDVIARAYARRNDPGFSDVNYRTAGQPNTVHASEPDGRSLTWLGFSPRDVATANSPKSDELERLAGLMGVPVDPRPQELPGDEHVDYPLRMSRNRERLRQQIRTAYLTGRGKQMRPVAGVLAVPMEPRNVADVAAANARLRRYETLSDDQRTVFSALLGADEARRQARQAPNADERRHVKERVWGQLVRALGGDPIRPLDQQPPTAAWSDTMAHAARAYQWVSLEAGGDDPLYPAADNLLYGAVVNGGGDVKQWEGVRKWFDARWAAVVAPDKKWYEIWK